MEIVYLCPFLSSYQLRIILLNEHIGMIIASGDITIHRIRLNSRVIVSQMVAMLVSLCIFIFIVNIAQSC